MVGSNPWRQELQAGIKPALRVAGWALFVTAISVLATAIMVITIIAIALSALGLAHNPWIVWIARADSGIILLAVLGCGIAFVRHQGRKVLERKTGRSA